MKIKALSYEDMDNASQVLWKSFYHAEKDRYSVLGMERFRDLTSPISLSINMMDGGIHLFGAFIEEDLVAVGAVKERRHILLLYVLPEWKGQGIGSALLLCMEKYCSTSQVTLNSSDGAIGFYQKRGYRIQSSRCIEEELVFTPMIKNIKIEEL